MLAQALALGIGNPRVRLGLGTSLLSSFPIVKFPTLIHPAARFELSNNRIGIGSAICPGVIATTNVTVGDFVLVNLSVTLGHDCIIGDGCVLNPSVNISGGVVLGPETLVCVGAIILEGRTIGARCTIGAGAVVTDDVPDGTTVVGVPARPIRANR